MHKVRFAIIPLALIAGTGLAACTQSTSSTPPTAASPLGSRHGWLSPAAKAQPIVYVSDYYANAIEIYPQGVDNPAPIGEITAGISGPLGNFVGLDGTLYVANTSNNTVTEYPKGSTSPSVTLSNGLNGPISVAADRRGNVAVGEFAAGDILEFPKGDSSPTVTIPLSYPEGLAFDRSNHLYAGLERGQPKRAERRRQPLR